MLFATLKNEKTLKNVYFVPDLKVPHEMIFKAKAVHVALTENF